jgi:hypothetical protein
MLIAKPSLKRMRSAVWRLGWTTMPTIGGCIETGAHQAIGAAFEMPRHEVVTIATGPGFSIRRASVGSQSRRMFGETIRRPGNPGLQADVLSVAA